MTDGRLLGLGRLEVAFVVVAVSCAASVFETRLAVFAILVAIIALAALSRSGAPSKWSYVLWTSLGLATLGLGRFIFQEALPGIAEARGRDAEKSAVSLLREIYFAQNAMRRYAMIDSDADGIGSAGRLAELTGGLPARGQRALPHPPLEPRLTPRIDTPQGSATEHDGYLFYVCVPQAPTGMTARSEDQVDDEQAERNWIAFAWPASTGLPHSAAYAIDEHERIVTFENRAPEGLVYVGPLHPPPCTAWQRDDASSSWLPWAGKQARGDLPGDSKNLK